jgi:hypothetical protein
MTDGNGNVIFSRSGTGAVGTFSFWGAGSFTMQPQANPIHDHAVMDGVVIVDVSANNPCLGAPVGPSWFNPGDGRIDPRPGDRVAVYCQADTVTVYGVLDNSQGVLLSTFKYADLVKAGTSGITRSVEPKGTVFIGLSGTSDLLVKWMGGPAAATGTRDFMKSFTCNLG